MRKHYKEHRLTVEDKKLLKEQTKPGIVIPTLLLLFGSIVLIFITVTNQIEPAYLSQSEFIFLSISLLILTSAILGYFISRKYISDLRNGVKHVFVKRIEKKEVKISHEAGSGSQYMGQPMNEVEFFAIIVDNTRYKIEKQKFDICQENGYVEFHIGPISRHLIRIVPKNEMANNWA